MRGGAVDIGRKSAEWPTVSDPVSADYVVRECEGVSTVDTSLNTPARARRGRVETRTQSQWQLIRAARAFYGRPLGVQELSKIKAAVAYAENLKDEAEAETITPPPAAPGAQLRAS
jgi:hypothetical protein